MAKPDITDNTIMAAIKTRFEAITAGSDYYTTFEKVYDNFPNVASIEKANTKIINLRDVSDDKIGEASEASQQLDDIDMLVEIDVIARGAEAANIRKMKADILKSIGTDLTWSAAAFKTRYIGSQRNRKDIYGNIISDLTITIGIQYRKNAWSNDG